MNDSSRNRLLVVCLATFHAAVFLLVLAATAYLQNSLGELLSNLSTLAGLALFGALWLASVVSTHWALRGNESDVESPDLVKMLGLGALWGGVNGTLFFLALIPIITLSQLLGSIAGLQSGQLMVLPIVLSIVALCGSPVAFCVGAFVGVLFAILDYVMLNVVASIFQRVADSSIARGDNG